MSKRGYILISIIFIIVILGYLKISGIKMHTRDNIVEMINANLKIGDVVKTKGYYSKNDNKKMQYGW